MDPQTLNSPSRPHRRKRITLLVAVLLLGIWAVVMIYRMEIRAHYWAYALAQCETESEREPYLIRLAAVEEHALGALEGLIDHPDADVRGEALYLAGRLDHPEVTALLLEGLGDDDSANAWLAACHLARRCNEAPLLQELIRMCTPGSDRSWEYAAVTLGMSRDAEAVEAILGHADAATEPDQLAVWIDALRLARHDSGIAFLETLTDDDRPITMTPPSERHLPGLLASMKPYGQVEGLDAMSMTMISPSDRTVGSFAAEALEMLRNPATLPAIAPGAQ